jgi:hypothetical protein
LQRSVRSSAIDVVGKFRCQEKLVTHSQVGDDLSESILSTPVACRSIDQAAAAFDQAL